MKRILEELSTLRGSRPRILLCDDQPINIRLANALLKGDYEIYMAGSGLFPTFGTANPTLTIAALALRTAAAIRGALPA